jgi:hypothetical protein
MDSKPAERNSQCLRLHFISKIQELNKKLYQ